MKLAARKPTSLTMGKFVALLRGISPLTPNVRNEKLRNAFIGMGFKNVQTVSSSGNIIFHSSIRSGRALEMKIEKTLRQKLGFKNTTVLRSETQFKKLVERNPFHGKKDTPSSRLNITFLKGGGEVPSIINTVSPRQPFELISQLENEHGKEITTRTWKTVIGIIKKLQATSS